MYFENVAKLCVARGAPEGWTVSSSEMLGNYPTYTHYQIKGACYCITTRGLRKGKPNWRRPIDGTSRTYVFEADEFIRLLADLEQSQAA